MEASPVRRVLMTADAMGGVWTYTRDLTTLLKQRGIEVLVAVTGRAPHSDLPVRVTHAPLSLEWQDRAGEESCAGTTKWLRQLAREFTPDVIHLNGYVQAAAQWNVPCIAVAHSCVCSWWRAVNGCDAPAPWDGYRARVQEGLMRADYLVAPSRAMAVELGVDYGVAPERVRVIFNGSGLEGEEELSGHASGPGRHLIAAAGRQWDSAKNLALLQGIASQLKWPLRIASGELSHRETMQLFRRSAIFAHAALYEPFGLVALEAARCGCALVLSDIPSMRELWEDAAVFVDPRQPDEWRVALNALVSDPERRQLLGARAQERSKRYSLSRFGEAYVSLYQEAMSTSRESVACA